MKKRLKQEKGASAVEFAVILPVLVLILFGLVEFGILLYNKQVLTNASREGARAGIVVEVPKKDTTAIKQIIKNYCNNPDGAGNNNPLLINFNGINNTINDSNIQIIGAQGVFGTDLGVTITYTYSFFVLSNLGFNPVELKATTIMKHE